METNSYLDFEINYGRIAMKMLQVWDFGWAGRETLTISIDIIFFLLQWILVNILINL